MKVSADNGDRCRVFLDGTEINHAFEADDEAGYIIQAVLRNGHAQLNAGKTDVLKKKLFGLVRIEPLTQE